MFIKKEMPLLITTTIAPLHLPPSNHVYKALKRRQDLLLKQIKVVQNSGPKQIWEQILKFPYASKEQKTELET